jgi:cystathionine beta-lyase/cystathionine gamma-synthase
VTLSRDGARRAGGCTAWLTHVVHSIHNVQHGGRVLHGGRDHHLLAALQQCTGLRLVSSNYQQNKGGWAAASVSASLSLFNVGCSLGSITLSLQPPTHRIKKGLQLGAGEELSRALEDEVSTQLAPIHLQGRKASAGSATPSEARVCRSRKPQ